MFPHLPAPIDNYSIFFLQLLLSFQSSSINPFSPISPLIPSAQLSLGLPRFLLPGGRHFITSFGNLPSSILWTCPYHWSCFVLISSKRYLVTFIFCVMIVDLLKVFTIEVPFISGSTSTIDVHAIVVSEGPKDVNFTGRPLVQCHWFCLVRLCRRSVVPGRLRISGFRRRDFLR